MPTRYGEFMIYGYVNKLNGEHHVALVKGDITDGEPVLCRVHSECLTGDALGSARCDCGQQYDAAMKRSYEVKPKEKETQSYSVEVPTSPAPKPK